MGRTNTKELMELFGVTRRTIVRWSSEPDFPSASRETPNGPNFWDLAAVKEWAVEKDFWDEVVDMPTRRRRRSYDRADIHGRRMRHGHDCVGCMEARQRHQATKSNRKQGSETTTEQGASVTIGDDLIGKYVVVKEDNVNLGEWTVWTEIPTPDGTVLGFLRSWTDAVVGYGERRWGVEVTRDIGGEVRPAHVGHDLVQYGGLVLNTVANEPALNVELSRGLEFGSHD